MKKSSVRYLRDALISYGVFIVMIVGILFAIMYLNRVCLNLESMNNNLEKYVNEESWDKAYNTSMEFFNKWEKYSDKISVFINHQEIDNLNLELWKLTQYVKCKNKDESLATIHAMKFLLSHVTNLERITLKNIF